jgi:Fe-S-cluster containining protein
MARGRATLHATSMGRKKTAANEPEFDCVTCGACCCNRDQNREIDYDEYVEVLKKDKINKHPELIKKLTFTNAKGEVHMRLVGVNQRCCALSGRLGESVSCDIYEVRPGVCRLVKAGDEECRKARIERGIDEQPEPKRAKRQGSSRRA